MALRRVLVGERVDPPSGNQLRKQLGKSRTIKGFRMKPGFIYTVVRAISARINQNYDGWPADELRKSHHTFIGKPVFVNHENYDPQLARGVVVASRFVENGNDQYVEVIQEIDAKRFPKLAHEIRTGGLDSVSMGAEAAFTICSYCKHRATDESDMCDHVMFHKGEKLRKFNRRTGKVDDILVYESCHKLSFFELCYVFDPADETAVASRVLVASTKQGVSSCPPGAVCDKPEEQGSTAGDFSADGGATGEPASSTTTTTTGEKPASGGNPDAEGILPQSRPLYDSIMADHPDLTIGGFRVDDYHEHDSGALDVMTSDEAVAKSVRDKAFAMGAPYVLWQQQQWNADGSVSKMEDRGSPTQNHMDHVHTAPFTPKAASPDITTASFERQVLRTAGYKDAGASDDYWDWKAKVESGEIEPEKGPKQYLPNKSLQDWSQRMRKRQSGFEEAVLKAAGFGSWSEGPAGSQAVLPSGHSLRVFAPNRNELIHDRGDPIAPATGSHQFEWVHTEHGMPLNSGHAPSEEEARRHAEQSHKNLTDWDPETDVFDPRHGFPSAGEWTANFEKRVLMAAGYRLGWGETEAPPEVDTLREEGSAPEDDNDDYHHYVEPSDNEFANNNESPQELQTPDLEAAGNIDREQDQQQQPQQGQAPGGSQMAPAGPQQQFMTLQIPMPPQQGQMPMQSFARRVLTAAGYRLAAEDDDDDDWKNNWGETDAPPPPNDPNAPNAPDKQDLNPDVTGVPAGTRGTLTQTPAPPGAAGAEHTEHTHQPANPTGIGGAALEDWQLPGGTNPTDPHGLAMPLSQSQVGQYSPTLQHNVTTEDVSSAANQGSIDAWNKANPTNVFDPNAKYDTSTMEKGVQHTFTMPGPPGAPPPSPAGVNTDASAVGTPPPGPTPPAEANAVIDQVGLGTPPTPPTPPTPEAPAPPQQTASRQLIAYFNQYFGTNVEDLTLENGRGVSRTDRARKGTTMGRSTLGERGKVASRGKRQHFADIEGGPYGRNDQGEQEEAFITETPPAEPVKMPDDDTHNISNTEDNLVARVNRGRTQLLADARQLAAFQAGKQAGQQRTAETISWPRAEPHNPEVADSASEELTGDHFESVGEPPQETQPSDSHRASVSLQAFQAFDNWLHKATGRQARHLSEVGIKRAASEWAKQSCKDPRVLFPALGIVLRQARKNEAAIKAAAQKKGAPMRRRAVDLEIAAPDERVDVEAPVANITDEKAQETQPDLEDFGHNAGDGIADPDLDTDSQSWAPGEGDKRKSSRKAPAKAGGILAVRAAEAYINAGLEPNTSERKYQLAGLFENMNRGAVQRDIALLERVAALQSQQRRKVASGRTRGAGTPIPPGLIQSGTVRSASTRRTSANDPLNDSLLFG